MLGMDHALPVAAPRLKQAPARELGIEVSMNAGSYTLLELQNFFLSVLTLGLYSAWAKVRRRKYITQHTKLDGHAFDFVAKPLVILRSRILVVAILLATTLTEELHPSLKLAGTVTMILAFPWAFTASTAFNARQTLYRGHPFVFFGKTKDAYIAFFKAYGISLITLGIGQLVSFQLFSSFVGNNTKLAGRRFSFNQPRRLYYQLALNTLGAFFLAFVALLIAKYVVGSALGIKGSGDELGPEVWLDLGFLTVCGAFYVYVAGVIRANLANLFFEGLALGPHTALCDIKPRTLGAMYLTNAAAILGSLGLAIPWAYLRCYKYRMSCITVLAQGELVEDDAAKLASGDGDTDAIGDAFLDIGFDFGV